MLELVAAVTTEGSFTDGLTGLLPVGGIAGAIAVIVVALIKARSSDRETVIRSQQQHMDRLTRERNDAVRERDDAYEANERLREARDQEREARLVVERQLRSALENTESLHKQIADLTTEVAQLRSEVAALNESLGHRDTPGESHEQT